MSRQVRKDHGKGTSIPATATKRLSDTLTRQLPRAIYDMFPTSYLSFRPVQPVPHALTASESDGYDLTKKRRAILLEYPTSKLVTQEYEMFAQTKTAVVVAKFLSSFSSTIGSSSLVSISAGLHVS